MDLEKSAVTLLEVEGFSPSSWYERYQYLELGVYVGLLYRKCSWKIFSPNGKSPPTHWLSHTRVGLLRCCSALVIWDFVLYSIHVSSDNPMTSLLKHRFGVNHQRKCIIRSIFPHRAYDNGNCLYKYWQYDVTSSCVSCLKIPDGNTIHLPVGTIKVLLNY